MKCVRNTKRCLCVSMLFWSGIAQAVPLYLFEYTGTVSSVGGSVTDGSLLSFSVGDNITGSFIFDAASFNPAPGTLTAFLPNTIEEFVFSGIPANGNQTSYSYFSLNASIGVVNAYKQVGTNSTYDNFSFILSPDTGISPFSDVTFDLTTLDINDFPMHSVFPNSSFALERVDISSSPLRFTEVRANFNTLNVSSIITVTEPSSVFLMCFGVIGIIAIRFASA